MKSGKVLAMFLVVSFVFIGAGLIFAQEANTQGAEPVQNKAAPEVQWQYVEVVSVDLQKNEILAKYLDYETDQQKEITISVDDKTTYENVGALAEIRPQDLAGIDYVVTVDGKNLATNINVEKPEVPSVAPQVETAPSNVTTEPAPVAGPTANISVAE